MIVDVYEHGAYDLSDQRDCRRFVEACARALSAWDPEGMWGHLAQSDMPGGHALDMLQSLAGRTVGMFRVIENGRPTFDWRAAPDGWRWFEES